MSFFDSIEGIPPDAILGLQAAFNADPRDIKINLSVGVYKTSDLKTPILKSVKNAERILYETESSKEYLPIDGQKAFIQGVGSLIFGDKFSSRICGFQAPGGTGALRVGAEFLRQESLETIYISDPTWANHRAIFQRAGMKVATYPYYDKQKNALDFEQLYLTLLGAPRKSVIVFHASCHNPTGMDLNREQWAKLAELCAHQGLIPFFDFAYQGFGEGLEKDAEAVRLFVEAGLEMLVASSYSKNFSLYAERVGGLFLVTSSEKTAQNCASKIKAQIRTLYSNPPLHGASIVAHILNSDSLKKQWEEELAQMRARITEMREAFAGALIARVQTKDYNYLHKSVGMFCFCSLEKKEVDRLISEYGIYMTSDGRVNIAGLTAKNLDYVIESIARVIS